MNLDLLNSIARVFGGSDPNDYDGTAFLFSVPKDSPRQLWMTCHHVIRKLPRLRLSCHREGVVREFDCEYLEELSSPQTDIAILATKIPADDLSLLRLFPLQVGAPPPGSVEERIIGCGFWSVKNHPCGETFVGRSSAYQRYEIPNDNKNTRSLLAEMGQPWNIPFADRRQIEIYEFLDLGARVEPGLSGSPVCIHMDSERVMCIGMLSARRVAPNSVPTHGYVIPFETLKTACGHALPFHAYADLIVVVLAATRAEFDELRPQLDMEELRARCDHYDQNSRDGWRPFELHEPTIKMLIADATRELQMRTWQLSSEYLGQSDTGFEAYLQHRGAGALVFVVDRNTYGASSLRRFLESARNHNRDACYVFPLCKEMHPRQTAIERDLQNDFSALWSEWHRDRIQFSWRREDFPVFFKALLDKAWNLFVHDTRSYPRRRINQPGRTAPPPFVDWSASR